jgi:porin
MSWRDIIVAAGLTLLTTAWVHAEEPTTTRSAVHTGAARRSYLQTHPESDTLTGNWFGLGEDLDDVGITSTLDLWTTYQANLTGGLETDDDFNGLYYWDTHFDLERMIKLPGAQVFLRVEGGWSAGINEYVGAIMEVNGAVSEEQGIGLTVAWFEQKLLDERVRLRIGKMDPSIDSFDFHGRAVAFDANPYGNSWTTQFLDLGLVNNASIGFAESAPGGMFLVEPIERWYVAGAATTANTNPFKLEIDTVFNGDAEWLFLAETGLALDLGAQALPGLYYVGYWNSGFEEDVPSGDGVYVGFSQLAYRESGSERQGLGVFARYGYADRSPTGIRHSWSLGVQYEGLIPGRDRDVLGAGWAQAFTNGSDFTAPYEGVLEIYYRARITPWLHLSPHAQFVVNPGSNDIDDAFTLGVRAQFTF